MAKEDADDRGKVFVCVVHVVYRNLDFLFRKEFKRTRHVRTFLFGHF